jgi:pimeloyl-ACP methyl ester carboxylesterase
VAVSEQESFWFGSGDRHSFGVLHRVPGATRGVVLCNAIGFEGLMAHRPLHYLAKRLADAGYPVLRFDYEGTGDSTGGDWQSGRFAAWSASIDDAVAVLQARAGVTQVSLVGFRLGATLAARYASEHPEIASLVLWAPCVDGRTHLRELRTLSKLSAAARPPQRITPDWFPEDSLEVAGFELTRPTMEEIEAIDLVAEVDRAPGAVLVIDDVCDGSGDRLVSRYEALGAEVDCVRPGGFTEFMVDDETTSVLPTEALDAIAGWLNAARGGGTVVDTGPVEIWRTVEVDDPAGGRLFPPGLHTPPVTERPVAVADGLFGILSEPADPTFRRNVGVLVLNTGSTVRSGQGRLSTLEARYWASLGFSVVRVDLGGTGDSLTSDPTTDNRPYAPDRSKEVFDAVEWLRGLGGVERVLIYGICSGAYHAFHAGLEGARIDAAALVNPGFFYLGDDSGFAVKVAHNAGRALTSRQDWRDLLRGGKKGSIGTAWRGLVYMAKARARLWMRGTKGPEIAADLERLARRDIRVLVVCATEEPSAHFLRTFGGQTLRRLQRSGQVTVVDVDGGDHVFSAAGARQRMVETVVHFLEISFPRPTRAFTPLRPTGSMSN